MVAWSEPPPTISVVPCASRKNHETKDNKQARENRTEDGGMGGGASGVRVQDAVDIATTVYRWHSAPGWHLEIWRQAGCGCSWIASREERQTHRRSGIHGVGLHRRSQLKPCVRGGRAEQWAERVCGPGDIREGGGGGVMDGRAHRVWALTVSY